MVVLDFISEILDNKSYEKLDNHEFYAKLLDDISLCKISPEASGVYFLDETSLTLKAQNNINSGLFKEESYGEILEFLHSNSKKTFCTKASDVKELLSAPSLFKNHYFVFSKLAIKESLFGFVIFIKKSAFTKDEISVINLYISQYSYLIKDYELNGIFKNQLSLLQDAISEKENAYKIIKKQNKKLIQADAAKTSFLANVSHELRTPLNAIIGFSDVLLNKVFGGLNEKQLEYIKDINLSSIHLMGLINSLLDFSKIESGSVKLQITTFNPKNAVDEVINILRPLLLAKEINIACTDEFNNTIKADYQKFQQILFNLLGNAIKFSKQKGEILVKIEKSGEYFILKVQDFGIGIDKKYHNFIFKKFTQIDSVYTKSNASTGLGLAITKEYVNLHSGKIFVESVPGQGSTFVVKLKSK